MEYYIYKITNLINNKSYIGQHKVPKNGESFYRYMGKGIAIREAIKKYGKENFSKEIIEYIDDDEKHLKVSEREIYWIKELNTMSPNGYNISPGGEGGCTKESAAKGVKTKRKNGYFHHSKETKEKMSKAKMGVPFSEVHKQHLSENHHNKTIRTIIFEDGHTETTDDSFDKISKRFGTNINTLIRYSAKEKFINGIYIKDIDGSKFACCKTDNTMSKMICKDPIKGDTCTYKALYQRKYKGKDKILYKDINPKDCIIEKEKIL